MALLDFVLGLVRKSHATFSTNSAKKQNTTSIVLCSHGFSRSARVDVFESSSDWFPALFTSIVICRFISLI